MFNLTHFTIIIRGTYFNLFSACCKGKMMETVWARDPTEGFILGLMSELTEDGAEIIPVDAKASKRICSFQDIYQTGDYKKEFDDNCK